MTGTPPLGGRRRSPWDVINSMKRRYATSIPYSSSIGGTVGLGRSAATVSALGADVERAVSAPEAPHRPLPSLTPGESTYSARAQAPAYARASSGVMRVLGGGALRRQS